MGATIFKLSKLTIKEIANLVACLHLKYLSGVVLEIIITCVIISDVTLLFVC